VIPGASGELCLRWASAADAGPFRTLAAHDRLAWEGQDCLTVLAAAAAVTRRVRLASLVLIAPLRATALLVKQAATLDALSGGRLTLGVGIGPRPDDYAAGEASFATRGRRFDEQLGSLRGSWELLIGGGSDRALVRAARHADGYVHAGGPPRAFKNYADRALAAWYDCERTGRPRLVGTGYFALGEPERGRADLLDYYRFTGPFSERIAGGLLTNDAEVREFRDAYAEAGCDELVLFPAVSDLDQVARLADVVG